MEESRHKRWIKASMATAKFDPFMIPTIQGLGRLDLTLIEQDSRFLAAFEKNQNDISASLELSDRITVSYLWVLGAYEALRTMGQRIRENDDLVSKEMSISFRDVKNTFNRLRIPLAKMEAAQSHRNTDSYIAHPAINRDIGISWQVNKNTFISRRELSDQLLALLENQRAEQIARSNT